MSQCSTVGADPYVVIALGAIRVHCADVGGVTDYADVATVSERLETCGVRVHIEVSQKYHFRIYDDKGSRKPDFR